MLLEGTRLQQPSGQFGLTRRGVLLGSLALAGCMSARIKSVDRLNAEADSIVRAVQQPRIAERSIEIVADPLGDVRPALHDAIDRLASSGGGRLLLPPGEWRSDGPVHLRSGIELHLSPGARLRFSRDPSLYLPNVLTRWEGTEVYNYSPLIYARGARDVAITGSGTVDGQGEHGFFRWRARQGEDQRALRAMGASGVPVEQRRFGAGHWLRPPLVQFFDCERVLIDGPTFIDSAFWMVHPVYCRHVTVRNTVLQGRQLNSDGVDPDSCEDVLIERCRFDVNDDCVAIKSGRDADGWRVARPTRRVVVQDCRMRTRTASGLGIGSEMSGGAEDVFATRLKIEAAEYGLYFKSNRDRGGLVQRVGIADVTVGRCEKLVHFTTDYKGESTGSAAPSFRDFLIEDVSCDQTDIIFHIEGLPERPITGIVARGIEVRHARRAAILAFVEDFTAQNIFINGRLWHAAEALGSATVQPRVVTQR